MGVVSRISWLVVSDCEQGYRRAFDHGLHSAHAVCGVVCVESGEREPGGVPHGVWCAVCSAGVLDWSAFAAHAASCFVQPGLS